MKRRVVITGLGAVSGLGIGVEPFWEGLVSGRSAIRRITRFDPSGHRCRLAAEAAEFTNARDYVPKSYRKAVKVMVRDTDMAVAAAKLALDDAGIATRGTLPEGEGSPTYPGARMGCHIGAGLISADVDELTAALVTAKQEGQFSLRAWGTEGDGSQGGMNNLPPLWMLKYLPNMLACHVTIIHGAEGPSNTITAMQASGLLCIGESSRVIERGDADLCFAGGAESPVNLLRLVRLELIGRAAETGDATDAGEILRPYDPTSRGGIPGEGGGILILEERESARTRGANAYAELLGFGSAQSAPDSESAGSTFTWTADGLQYAAEAALQDAGVEPEQVDAIVPQACGVPAVDAAETEALRGVFGGRLARIPLVTLAPAVGDCLAGAGGLATGAAALCLRQQHLPARMHSGEPAADLRAGPAAAEPAALRTVLVLTSSIGGQNAAVVLGRAS